jgi:hypothetical protein
MNVDLGTPSNQPLIMSRLIAHPDQSLLDVNDSCGPESIIIKSIQS